MKLGNFSLLDTNEEVELFDTLAQFNASAANYPRDKTVSALFVEQAQKTPHATAIIYDNAHLTYEELDQQSNQVAHFLLETGLIQSETAVGLMLDRSFEVIVAMLGILKAGGYYLPINPDFPLERIIFMLNDTNAPILISDTANIRALNRLQWECPNLAAIVCVDSDDIHAVIEPDTDMMDQEMWGYIAEIATDDIIGGGWKSSYTGDWLSREVMDNYGDNIRDKLAPYVTPQSRILEIGCASGISMLRLAPLVGRYVGTDLSQGIIDWVGQKSAEQGFTNIDLHCLSAHEIKQLEAEPFDIVIINSVIECFPGHNYFHDVVAQAIDHLSETGWLFLGNVWNQDKKAEFVASLIAYQKAHPSAQTKIDRTGELFISPHYLEDLRHDFPEIVAIEYSKMLGDETSELSEFGFDAFIRIDKRKPKQPAQSRYKQQFDRRAVTRQPRATPAVTTSATDLAYVMYTSGSTGKPKGVLVENRPILRLVCNTNYINLKRNSVILQTGAFTFDAATFEIWGALLNGGATCLPQDKILLNSDAVRHLIQDHKITDIFITTSLFNQIVETDITIFANLKTVLSGGEKVSVQHFNKLRTTFPHINLLHVYGPTENTTFSTYYPVEQSYDWDIPIGYPIANTSVHILDGQLQPVPIGTVGELCVGGDGLARGYLNAPELTAERFVTIDENGTSTRIYRTGDLARWLPEGTVAFIGRKDDQVKIRGFRIEPGEIAAQLAQHDKVETCVVVTKILGDEKVLVAYFVSPSTVTSEQLRAYLRLSLPAYMLPTYFIQLDQMPLNKNGKTDRHALPDPTLEATDINLPQTETEKQLAAIWAQVLGHKQIDCQKSFFDMGGHSLKVTQLIAQIEQKLAVTLPITAVFNAPTVQEQAEIVLNTLQFGHELADEGMVLLNADLTRNRPNLFAFPPGTGDILGFIQLAETVPDLNFYGFNFLTANNRIARYADQIMETDPEGPYVLFGYSSGGNLAYYVAHELELRGKQVSHIIMVDSARRLQPYRASDEEIKRITDLYMQNESVQPYLTSDILREKQARLIYASFDWIGSMVDRHEISAEIHVILSEDEAPEYHDKNGTLIASVPAWADVTMNQLIIHNGYGQHNVMLNPPYLAQNSALILAIATPTVEAVG